MLDIFKYIKAVNFVPEFTRLKFDGMFKHKMRGKDGNGQPIAFTDQEKAELADGIKRFAEKYLKKVD